MGVSTFTAWLARASTRRSGAWAELGARAMHYTINTMKDGGIVVLVSHDPGETLGEGWRVGDDGRNVRTITRTRDAIRVEIEIPASAWRTLAARCLRNTSRRARAGGIEAKITSGTITRETRDV